MKRANSSGVLPLGSAPRACMRLRTSESARARLASALSLSTTGLGVGGGEEAEPADGFVAGEAGLGDGRELGQGFGALGAGGGERFQFAGSYVLDHGLRRREEQVDLACEQISDRLAGALVGHVQQARPPHLSVTATRYTGGCARYASLRNDAFSLLPSSPPIVTTSGAGRTFAGSRR